MPEAGTPEDPGEGDAAGRPSDPAQASRGTAGADSGIDRATVFELIEQRAKTARAELATVEERISGQLKRIESIPSWWGFIGISLAALAAGFYMFSSMLQYGVDRESEGAGLAFAVANELSELRGLIESNARTIDGLMQLQLQSRVDQPVDAEEPAP